MQDTARPPNYDDQNYIHISGQKLSGDIPSTVPLGTRTETIRRALNIPNTYSIRSSGIRRRASARVVSPANLQNYALPASSSETALNTIGIPVYNNHLLYDGNNMPPNFTSPSNYPTMLIDNRREQPRPKLKDVANYIHHTIPSSRHAKLSTKHLKPPKNKLKNVVTPPSSNHPVKINQATNYALPAANQQAARPNAGYVIVPTAPIMYESPECVDPLHLSGSPPSYATVDPRKLRTKHIKPVTFGVAGRRYQPL